MRVRTASVSLICASVALLSILGTVRAQGAPQSQLLALFESPARTSLSRLDATTLARDSRSLRIGEYHWSSSVSPDGNTLALATGGPGGGLQIVDLPSLTTRHRVPTDIAPEAVAWLTATTVIAGLQCIPVNVYAGCAVVAIDAAQGTIVRRWPADKNVRLRVGPPLNAPKPILRTRYGVVLVLGDRSEIAPAVLVLITPNLELRQLTLERIMLSASSTAGATVLRGTSERKCAVIGPDGTIADVDLEEMTVRYHDVLADRLRDGTERRETWVAGAIDGSKAFVYGVPRRGTSVNRANQHYGVMWLDTSSWNIGVLDSEAAYARSSSDKVFVYGGRVGGLRAYALDGTRLFQTLETETFSEPRAFVHAIDDLLYVVTHETTTTDYRIRALSPVNGKVLIDGRGSGQIIELVSVR